MRKKEFVLSIVYLFLSIFTLHADNQTPDVSPIFPNSELPFRIRIETTKTSSGDDFLLPVGLQSFCYATYHGKWLLITGLENGLHGFNPSGNFPPNQRNQVVYVVDPKCRKIMSRSLNDPLSGLTQEQIDSLSVSNAQFYQKENTLYISGGSSFRASTNIYTTFPILSIIDVPGLMHWVTHKDSKETAARSIHQIENPIFQITGGYMQQLRKKCPSLLVFGQFFEGEFSDPTQIYSQQVRRFKICDKCRRFSLETKSPKPSIPDPNYRRRDLNVIPVITGISRSRQIHYALVALSGVFTETDGVWTVPVTICPNGDSSMANPSDPLTFKQGMNNYQCADMRLYSEKTGDNYMVLFGGISYGFFVNGVFVTDPQIPFINQVTTVKRDKNGVFTQYLMDAEFPVILSTESNPGNPLLFGATAQFIPANDLEKFLYEFDIFKFDKIKRSMLLGYIVGGIQSTLPNTNAQSDTAASPYIFSVFLEPIK